MAEYEVFCNGKDDTPDEAVQDAKTQAYQHCGMAAKIWDGVYYAAKTFRYYCHDMIQPDLSKTDQ